MPRQPVIREEKRNPVVNTAQYAVEDTPPPDPGESVALRELVRVVEDGNRLPFVEAIKLETDAFMRLAGSDESKRLIAEFFASRKK
jgi:hypothetical protein